MSGTKPKLKSKNVKVFKYYIRYNGWEYFESKNEAKLGSNLYNLTHNLIKENYSEEYFEYEYTSKHKFLLKFDKKKNFKIYENTDNYSINIKKTLWGK